jgi:hypothetical protein
MSFRVIGIDMNSASGRAAALRLNGLPASALDCRACHRPTNMLISGVCDACRHTDSVGTLPPVTRSTAPQPPAKPIPKRPRDDPWRHGAELAASHEGDPWAFGASLEDVRLDWGDAKVMRSRPQPVDGFSVSAEPGKGLIVLADNLMYDESGYRDLVLLHELAHVLGWRD